MALGLALSLLIGVALGLFGGGGSILSVPILTYVLGVPPKAAIAGSLLIVGVTSSVALVSQLRAGLVEVRAGLAFGAAAMVGAYFGGRLTRFVPDAVLLTAFGAMMLVTAGAMLRGKALTKRAQGLQGGRASLGGLLLLGSVVGLVAGLLGAGGGFLIVPALVLLGGLPMRRAIATSLLVISLQSAAGFLGHLDHADIPWRSVVPVTLLATIGSLLGVLLARRVQAASLRRGFAWLVMAVAVFVLGHQAAQWGHTSPIYTQLFVTRWPWWLGGAAVAAVVLGFLYFDGKQLGVSSGCGELCRLPFDREARASWRPHFLFGIVAGGAVAALLAGRGFTWSMGGLDAHFTGHGAKLVVLFFAGCLIGGGARLAGGCTSGHGIVGTALGARASWLATALFMLGGFATTRLLLLLTGGS